MRMYTTFERNRTIYEARNNGMTFAKVGEKCGVTANRAKQIYEREKRSKKLSNINIMKYYLILLIMKN